VVNFCPSMKTGQAGASPVPGSEIPILAAFDSPGPFTTQPITASRMVLDARILALPFGHLLSHVRLDALGEGLERRAGRAPAPGQEVTDGGERPQAERLEELARA